MKPIIKKIIKEEVNLDNNIKNILSDLKITNYKILGYGQSGVVINLLNSNKCLKITTSKHEFKIAEEIKNKQYSALPKIYKTGIIDDFFYYTRDCYEPIDDNLAETIDENIDEIADFFLEKKNWDARKSNTNLEYEFDDNFLIFLSQLKKDLFKLNLLPFEWDIDGLSLNTYKNKNSYILVDF